MQINQYPVTATIIKDEYLFDMDAEISVGVWQSQKVPWALINDTVALKVGTTSIVSGTNNRLLRIEGGKVGQSDYSIPKTDGTSGQALITNGAGAATWQTISTGITVGTTTITSGTNNRVFFQNSGVISQDSGFNFNATNKTLWNNGKGGIASNNSFGENALGTNTTGATNSAFGYNAGRLVTTGSNNTFLGYGAGGAFLGANLTGNDNVIIGAGAGGYLSSGIQNTFIGNNTGTSITTGSYNTIIGMNGTSFPSGFVQNVVISDGSGQTALWKDSSNRIGFGYSPASDTLGAKVDIKAQGALSTDLALRVRSSANTIDNFVVNGKGHISARANNNTQLYIGGSNTDMADPSYYSVVVAGYSNVNYGFRTTIVGSENTFSGTQYGTILGTRNTLTYQGVVIGDSNTVQNGITIGNNNTNRGSQSAVLLGNGNIISATNGYPTKPFFVVGSNINVPNDININNSIYFGTRDTLDIPHAVLKHDNFMIGSMNPTLANYDANSRGVFYTKNSTAPTTLPVDSVAFYSSDIVAGNAAPHFRTENGAIIKLYQETTAITGAAFVSGGAGTNIKTDDTFGGYTLQQIAAALKNIGILA